jgi:hypothetical protein
MTAERAELADLIDRIIALREDESMLERIAAACRRARRDPASLQAAELAALASAPAEAVGRLSVLAGPGEAMQPRKLDA